MSNFPVSQVTSSCSWTPEDSEDSNTKKQTELGPSGCKTQCPHRLPPQTEAQRSLPLKTPGLQGAQERRTGGCRASPGLSSEQPGDRFPVCRFTHLSPRMQLCGGGNSPVHEGACTLPPEKQFLRCFSGTAGPEVSSLD